jgi:23S rRNA (adenine2030-N6)-methyltransferase
VLKHVVLVQLFEHLTAKEKGFSFVDTHAGAGSYSLSSVFALKNAEFRTGISRLWSRDDLPPALERYLAQVRSLNSDGELRFYPGSPQIALQMTRPQDRLHFFELHSSESEILQAFFPKGDKRIAVRADDGFEGIKALLPPPSRRALVLIDPSYEDKSDYRKVAEMLRDALKRFATGIYAVWYPMVRRGESQHMAAELRQIAPGDWLHVSLKVGPPPGDGFGLFGSGMFVLNPPWNLEAALKQAAPVLGELLGEGPKDCELQFRQT